MSTTKSPSNPLYAELLAAQAELVSIGHDSKNAFHKYAYTSSEHMISVVRPILIKNGLVFAERETGVNVSETDNDRAVVTSECVLAHPDSGMEVSIISTFPAISERGRPLDKAVAGARTVNIGYALRGLMNLPRGEEAAAPDQRDDTKYDPNVQAEIKKLGKGLITLCAALDFA